MLLRLRSACLGVNSSVALIRPALNGVLVARRGLGAGRFWWLRVVLLPWESNSATQALHVVR